MKGMCAYCQSEGQLTREHIVPSFVYTANPLAKLAYNVKAGKFVRFEAQIRDVCAECNNKLLSKVDSYAKRFCAENRIDVLVTSQNLIHMTYDWSWLCRFLLKVTFNCLRFRGEGVGYFEPFSDYARKRGWDANPAAYGVAWLRPFADFILYGVDYPSSLGVKFGVEVTPCHRIRADERHLLPQEFKNHEYLPPMTIRMGWEPGIPSRRILVRFVSINNFMFHVFILKRPFPAQEYQAALNHFSAACPDVTFLDPHTKSTTCRVSSRSALDTCRDTYVALFKKWTEYEKREC